MIFFLTEVATEMEITDDQYLDRRILLAMLSIKIFRQIMSYINGINPSVKLFNGVVLNEFFKFKKTIY